MSIEESESDTQLRENNLEMIKLSQLLTNSEESLQQINEELSTKERILYNLREEYGKKKEELFNKNENIIRPIKFIKTRFEKKELTQKIEQMERAIKISNDDNQGLKNKIISNIEEIADLKGKIEKTKEEIAFIISQREKGLELFEGRWVNRLDIPRLKEIRLGLSNNFSTMSGFEFEYFVSRLLQEMGYTTEVTKKTGDYGIDIIAKKDKKIVAVQCKRYAETNPVGNQDVQKCLGSMHKIKAKQSIFVTTSYFTKQALIQAEKAPIELWDKDTFHNYVKKYLLSLDIKDILGPIELEHQKEKEKKQQEELEKNRIKQQKIEQREKKKKMEEEKRERDRKKTICPHCGKRKRKSRKYCSRPKCIKSRRLEKRRHKSWF
jgi:Holliday junction resolvase-like predicted endonuclease